MTKGKAIRHRLRIDEVWKERRKKESVKKMEEITRGLSRPQMSGLSAISVIYVRYGPNDPSIL